MSSAAQPIVPHDGTDAEARPMVAVERTVLRPAGRAPGPGILAPIVIGLLALGLWEAAVRLKGIPSYILPGPLLIVETLVNDWATLSQALLITLAHHLRRAHRGGGSRRVVGGDLHAVEVAREIAASLRRHPAGHADRLHRAAHHHLDRRYQPVAPDLRLDRRLLPDPVEHDRRAQFRRPQSDRPVPALSGQPLANAALPALAGGASLFPRRA